MRTSKLRDGAVTSEKMSRLFAVIDPGTGDAVRGSGVAFTSHTEVGIYHVRFNRSIRDCAYIATIGLTASGSTPSRGFLTVNDMSGNNDGVTVRTYTVAEAVGERGFHLQVVC